MTTNLDNLALKWGTDKSSKDHFYTKYYEQYFEKLRYKDITILEIGIDKGSSLLTWQEYFPNAKIYGLDIDYVFPCTERIITFKGSQNNIGLLEVLGRIQFDIIIDDGSHLNKDMLISFDTLFPILNNGGIYVVEDLHACYWRDKPVFMDRLKSLMDDVNSRGKRGIADIHKFRSDGFYKRRGFMNWWEKSIEFIHLYPSIVFIKKNDVIPREIIPDRPPFLNRLLWKIKYQIRKWSR